MTRCYGRLPVKPVALGDLTHYLTSPLPAPPNAVTAPQLNWPMAGNDQYGDCTIAGVVHTDQASAAQTKEPWSYVGDNTVVNEYFNLSGGQDAGLVETDVLRVWSTTGLFGRKIAAFAPLAVKHAVTLKQAVWLCGAVYTGVLVPAPAQQQFGEHKPWALTGTAADDEIEGGHCIVYVGYNATGPIAVTWGALQQVTWGWHMAYCEEAYAILTAEVKARGSLRGINFRALEADLATL